MNRIFKERALKNAFKKLKIQKLQMKSNENFFRKMEIEENGSPLVEGAKEWTVGKTERFIQWKFFFVGRRKEIKEWFF